MTSIPSKLSTKKPKCKNQKAWEEEFSGIKPSLLILAGFLVDNFEGMEVTGPESVLLPFSIREVHVADYAIRYGMHALTTLYRSRAICRHVRESGRLLTKSVRTGENLERYMNPGDFPLNRETWSLCDRSLERLVTEGCGQIDRD